MVNRITMLDDIKEGYFKNKIVRDFTRDNRRVYRLLIVMYFVSSQYSDQKQFEFSRNFLLAMHRVIKDKKIKNINESVLKRIESHCVSYLNYEWGIKVYTKERDHHDPIENNYIDDNILTKASNFFQKYSESLDSGKTLYKYNELESFWDLELVYRTRGAKVLSHHWFDLSPFVHPMPILTMPEFFAYQDLISMWNITLEKEEHTQKIGFSFESPKQREARYTFVSSLRTTLVLSIQFFETYLFYLYYNFREQGKFPENSLIKSSKIRTISDAQILKQLLYIEYPNLNDKLKYHHSLFAEALEDRNAFVHMSAFEEDNNKQSRMQRLINLDVNTIIMYLQNIIDMMIIIENEIGEDRILFWWERVEYPDFHAKKKINSLIK